MLSGSFREKLLWKIGKSWLENTCAGTSFLIKLLILNLAHILAHAFFLEFCRIVKKACFKQHLWRAASGNWQYFIPLLVSVFRNGVFNNFAKFLDKKLTWGLFYSKVAGFKPATLLKNRLRHKCFSVNFAEFLKVHIQENIRNDCFRKLSNFHSFIGLCRSKYKSNATSRKQEGY